MSVHYWLEQKEIDVLMEKYKYKQTLALFKGRCFWPAILFLSIVLSGTILGYWLFNNAIGEMREDLLRQTRQVAQALSITNLHTLSGTNVDVDSPVYLRIKEQLATIRVNNPKIKSVYLMGRKPD